MSHYIWYIMSGVVILVVSRIFDNNWSPITSRCQQISPPVDVYVKSYNYAL